MGTNFYWRVVDPEEVTLPNGEVVRPMDSIDNMDPRIHIGKRSAAGKYCWDCHQTFCKGGEEQIHLDESDWYDACPKCGKKEEKSDHSSGLVELGFQKAANKPPTGVSTATSFSWAQYPSEVKETCSKKLDEVIVVDEYSRGYTGQEFLDMIESNCPIWFRDSIGTYFC